MNILRGGSSDLPVGVLPGPAPKVGDRPGTRHYEMPLIFADHNFNTDGSLNWPTASTQAGPYIPYTDIPPIWINVTQGSVMVVNGHSWPYLEVEPRRYRFRLLDVANFRPLSLKIVTDPTAVAPADPAPPVWVIGSDGGFLSEPVKLDTASQPLQILPAERYDVIVDFTGLSVGTKLYLTDEFQTFTGGEPNQIMQFRVVPLKSHDTGVRPDQLSLPSLTSLPSATNLRRISFQDINSIVTVRATFDHIGRYVWHCHFLDHEDNAMMRPWTSVPR
jgi:spore coat protein A, manganese oxidase